MGRYQAAHCSISPAVTYLDYIVFFEKCDQQQPKGFSGNTTRLYHKLLALANTIGWPAEFAKSDPYVAGVCNLAINTMKECRKELVAAGMITAVVGGTGRNAATTYKLLNPSKIDVFPAVNQSKIDGFTPEATLNDSNSDGFSIVNASNSDGFTSENSLNPSKNTSNFDTLYIDKEEVVVSAADAATPPASLPVKKTGAKKPKAKGATHEEIAALPLPFEGSEFAETWHTFYTTNTKQHGKAITAFSLMLKKLGAKPEAFAVLMLEKAIMGNWQGVENGGTARDFLDWQAEQARRPTPAPTTILLPATTEQPKANEEFLAQQAAAAAAEQKAHFDKYATA